MTVTITLDEQKIKQEAEARINRTQFYLDSRIAGDSNFYCPQDTGNLKSSVFPVDGNGTLEWNADYASKMYYSVKNLSKGKNPNASIKWFERAKATRLKDWENIANEEYHK